MEIEVFGYRFADTIEAAALEAITTFCEQHPNEVAEYPIGLFPAVDYHDPEWTFRVEHCALSTWLVRHKSLIASWIGTLLK